MGDFKTCDIHDKEFPANLIDTAKTSMSKLYLEKSEVIEGKKVTLTLFVGKNENEGVDMCHKCMMTAILERVKALNNDISWKNVSWEERDMQRKDGTGTYKRNFKVVKTTEEIAEELKQAKTAPTPTAK